MADHPDQDFVNTLLSYKIKGIPLGYEGPFATREHKNWPSTDVYADHINACIQDDVQHDRARGTFKDPPLHGFIASPTRAVPKKSSSKVRLVNDLSFPPGISVNDNINIDCSVTFTTIDDAVKLIQSYRPGSVYSGNIDIKDAFKEVPRQIRGLASIGVTWPNDPNLAMYYYYRVLIFGCRSSPKLF